MNNNKNFNEASSNIASNQSYSLENLCDYDFDRILERAFLSLFHSVKFSFYCVFRDKNLRSQFFFISASQVQKKQQLQKNSTIAASIPKRRF